MNRVRDRCRMAIPLAGLFLLAQAASVFAARGNLDSPSIVRFVETQMRLSRIPGVALAIVRPGEEVYSAAFASSGANITADSPFLIGSVTKTVTALAVAQLVDAGKLRFDDPVSVHLPRFAVGAPDSGRAITIRHLLTHTSGFSQWSGHDRRAQREARFDHISPVRPPGTVFEYSSLNYIILGQVVEAVSGMPYAEYVQREIFVPLEMRNSFLDLEEARRHGFVRGHRYLYGLTIPGSESQKPAPLVPAGFMISTARDLGNYLSMLLNEGRFRDRQVVSPDALREMFRPWDGAPTGAGMAWGIGRRSIGHAGSTATFSARLSLMPAERTGIIVLTNVNSGPFLSGTAALMNGVTGIVRGEPAAPARPDEILLKVILLILVIAGVVRVIVLLRRWSRRRFPRRWVASRRVALPLIMELAGAVLVLVALPRWIGVPLLTIVEYFPDLGLAMLAGVVTGLSGAVIRSLIVSDEMSIESQTGH